MRDPTPSNPGSERSLADLCAAAAQGDRPAFDAIHRRLSGGVRKLFLDRSAGRADLAEELGQRTWVGVWQSISTGKYDPSRAAISTFVYAVASKVWLQHLRGAKRGVGSADALEAAFGAGDDPAEAIHAAELIQAVRQCLAAPVSEGGLTEDERWLAQAAATGASDRDLARRLSISPSTANARKRAALEKVRRYLAQRGHRPETPERTAPAREKRIGAGEPRGTP
jgi:RNA polymerase sigma factor (sigma-70 family)